MSESSRLTPVQITMMIAVVILLIVSIRHTMDPMPNLVVPNPRMPIPNGYDVASHAGVSLKDRDAIMGIAFPMGRFRVRQPVQRKVSADLVSENEASLLELGKALAMPYRLPPVRSLTSTAPGTRYFRDLTGLLILESQVMGRHNDWAGAARTALDAVRFAEIMPLGGCTYELTFADRCLISALDALSNTTPHLDFKTNLVIARRLTDLNATHVPFADSVEEEKWATLAGLRSLLVGPHWRKNMEELARSNGNGGPTISVFTSISRQKVISDYEKYMDHEMALAKLPYSATSVTWSGPDEPVLRNLIVPNGPLRSIDADALSHTALTILKVAIDAYHAKHGTYPESLQALLPDCLKIFPQDPLSSGGLPIYTRAKDGYTLTSTNGQIAPAIPGLY